MEVEPLVDTVPDRAAAEVCAEAVSVVEAAVFVPPQAVIIVTSAAAASTAPMVFPNFFILCSPFLFTFRLHLQL
jgi:hypothetical protein